MSLENGSTRSNLPVPAEQTAGRQLDAPGWYDEPGYAPAADPGEAWRRRLSTLHRYRWLVGALVLVGILGGVIATRFIQPRYQAQATVWIEAAEQRNDRGPIREAGLLSESRAWTELLRSFVVLDTVVAERKLYVRRLGGDASVRFDGFALLRNIQWGRYRVVASADGRSYALRGADGAVIEEAPIGQPLGGAVGFEWAPDGLRPGSSIEFEITSPRQVSGQLASELRTWTNDQRGSFLRVTLTDDSAEEAAATLSAIINRFVAVAGELKRAKLDELTDILGEQLAFAEASLKDAEMSLEGFRVQTITLPSEQGPAVAPGLESTRDPVFAQFFHLRITAEQIRQESEAISRILSGPPGSIDGLEAIGSVRSHAALSTALQELNAQRAELRALQLRYTSEHPLVMQAAGNVRELETVTIPQLARGLQAELARRGDEVGRQVQAASGDLRQIPPRMIEEARLRRQVAIAEDLYTTLQQRFSEARLAAASSIPDVRVLDEPQVPREPLKGTSALFLLLGGLGAGLGLAAGAILLLDRFDSKVRYPGQITAEIGLPILAAIPHLLPDRVGVDGDDATDDRLVEAFRSLRFNLLQAFGAAGPIVLSVSSPGRGEGKSFVSAHLALSLAATGKRTLLIDGDIRRGALHRFFGMSRGEGLLDCLRHGKSLKKMVRQTSHDGLDLLTGGRRLARGPELLGSAAMRELLAHARASYDVIIVDSPPFGAGADAFILGTMAGNMLVVLRTGTSVRSDTGHHMEMLHRLPIRLLGAAMNDVPEGGFYRYYPYSYLPGYEARDEDQIEDVESLQITAEKQ